MTSGKACPATDRQTFVGVTSLDTTATAVFDNPCIGQSLARSGVVGFSA